MSDVTRLWLLVSPNMSEGLVLPPQLELAGVVSGTGDEAAASALAESHGGHLHLDEELARCGPLAPALTRWARHFAREQCALVCTAAAVREAVGEALGVGDARRFELRPGGCATLDWPLEVGASGAPPMSLVALVGFDLDWTPVFQSSGRPKFPGGPGVASSDRA